MGAAITAILPLDAKVIMTKNLIRDWVDYFGLYACVVSFSGGKDSTVLLHIARQVYPDIKAMFCDTGLEFPEIRKFVFETENIDIVCPKLTFKEVIDKSELNLYEHVVFIGVKNMNKVFKAKITWLSKEQGGRQTLPTGDKYAPIVKITKPLIEKTNTAWSIVVINEKTVD